MSQEEKFKGENFEREEKGKYEWKLFSEWQWYFNNLQNAVVPDVTLISGEQTAVDSGWSKEEMRENKCLLQGGMLPGY